MRRIVVKHKATFFSLAKVILGLITGLSGAGVAIASHDMLPRLAGTLFLLLGGVILFSEEKPDTNGFVRSLLKFLRHNKLVLFGVSIVSVGLFALVVLSRTDMAASQSRTVVIAAVALILTGWALLIIGIALSVVAAYRSAMGGKRHTEG
jgi:hypothetical protein